MKVVVLSGGTGTPKFLEGLKNVLNDFTVIVNTGDDWKFYGLHVCPDVDSVLYTLAGIIDFNKYWGINGDTFNLVNGIERYFGENVWFRLGDADTAISLYRTHLLSQGLKLSKVIQKIAIHLGIKQQIIPMTENKISTMINTNKGVIHLEEYWVREKGKPKVYGIEYHGKENAIVPSTLIDSIYKADRIIIGPSNPVSSIGPIIGIKEIYTALVDSTAIKVAISPFVGTTPISGPAGIFMNTLGKEASCRGLIELYQGFIDHILVSERDKLLLDDIDTSIKVIMTNIIMKDLSDKIKLAKEAISCD